MSMTDVVAFRLQLQGELQAKNEVTKKYKGVFHGVKVILQNEGPRGLFRGIGCAVCVCDGADDHVADSEAVHLPDGSQWMPIGILRTAS